jgi:predicted DNA-binding transcriptional regulator YafY
VNAELHLKYKDGNGQRTERAVDIRQYGQWEGGYLLIGHCHLRNATRTFRTDRITEAVDRTTGEVIPELGTYLDRPYTDSPDRAVDLLLETDLEAIAILLFVAKADGAMRAPERKVIVDTCRALAGDSRITDERIVGLLREFEVPTMSAYQSAVKRMAERPDATRRQILAAAEAIVGTQRTVHPMEAGALSHLREQLVHGQTRE